MSHPNENLLHHISTENQALVDAFIAAYPTNSSLLLTVVDGVLSAILEQGGESTVFPIDPDNFELPIVENSVSRILCVMAAHRVPDTYKLFVACYQVLQPEGVLFMLDYLHPNKRKPAQYLDALFRLRDANYKQAYPEYAWRGTLLDAGFTVDSLEKTIEQQALIPPEITSQQQKTRLQILLVQAPSRVTDWLEPTYPNTDFAAIHMHSIAMTTHK